MMPTKGEAMEAEEVQEQWPGFTVKCQKCGSELIELENSMGFSVESGTWGSIDFVCLSCGKRASIIEG